MKKMIDHVAKGKEILVGLEDSKRTWKLSVRSNGHAIQEVSMEARYKILSSYLKKNYPDCSVHVMYEAGFKGFGLHDSLIAEGFMCTVTPPHTVKVEKFNRTKNDRVDARILAINLERGDYTACHIPEKELRIDRQVSRRVEQIKQDITCVKNRIRKFLDFHGFAEILPPGAWYDRDYLSLKDLPMSPSLRTILDMNLKQLGELQAHMKDLRKLLKDLSKDERYAATFKVFESAPGVGWYTAIRLVLEWGPNLSRFSSGKKFASFTGLTTSEYSTGESIRKGRITRMGNRRVRAWLIECAWTAYKRDPALLEKFEAVYKSCGSKKKAIVAVAHKLAVRLRSCALSGQPYQLGTIQ